MNQRDEYFVWRFLIELKMEMFRCPGILSKTACLIKLSSWALPGLIVGIVKDFGMETTSPKLGRMLVSAYT